MPKKVNVDILAERLENVHIDVRDIKEMVKIQNCRVRKLENVRNIMTGALIVLSGLVGYGVIKLQSLFGV